MRSKAAFKSHPLHPILVSFPIAFYTGTLVFDIWTLFQRKDDLSALMTLIPGAFLHAGAILTAIIAAIPGFIDYLKVVPPHSSGKKRAAKHGLLNVSTLILFCIAGYLKYRNFSFPLIVAIEAVGFILTLIAGWLGGTLVYRNQIGVDIRYANAGKWKELYIDDDATAPYEVCTVDELKTNQMKLVHVKDKRIVVARREEGYVAFDDRCTHRGGSLAGGAMICGTVQCPWHGSHFDVATGEVKAGPATESIRTYSVSEASGKILLSI